MNETSSLSVSNPLALKIVVAGVHGCGQSTFVNALSELAADVPSSPQSVAMDFGRIQIDDNSVLYLFGMPGGRRFDFMWEILKDGFVGWIVMLDSKHPGTFRESKSILETFRAYAPAPYVIAANFQDSPDAWNVADLRLALHIAAEIAIIPCVATDRESVKGVLLTLLDKVIEAIDEPDEQSVLQ